MLRLEDATAELDRLVELMGQTRFSRQKDGCYYRSENGAPLCIVGWVLKALEPEVFEQINTGRGGTNGTNFEALANDPFNEIGLNVENEDVMDLLRWTQWHQDNGQTWEEAVTLAKTRLHTRNWHRDRNKN